jgi:nitroimidazol reductase NimA-like FMN-containing flavoprotein (pyridoxamine 5'-phosphate oxidase superfamily)
MSPRAELLRLPDGYGTPSTTLDWAEVRARLEEARAYWVATCRPDGRPHVVPVDGLWFDDVFYYGGGPDAVHVRSARANPEVVMHLADPHRSVIVEGRVRPAAPGAALARRLLAASNAKYPEYGTSSDPAAYDDALALHPRRVLAWSSYPRDATRFLFDEAGAT